MGGGDSDNGDPAGAAPEQGQKFGPSVLCVRGTDGQEPPQWGPQHQNKWVMEIQPQGGGKGIKITPWGDNGFIHCTGCPTELLMHIRRELVII